MALKIHSVGRGANPLLNIAPERLGLLPETDASRLLKFGAGIRRRFEQLVASPADFEHIGDCWRFRPSTPTLTDHCMAQ